MENITSSSATYKQMRRAETHGVLQVFMISMYTLTSGKKSEKFSVRSEDPIIHRERRVDVNKFPLVFA